MRNRNDLSPDTGDMAKARVRYIPFIVDLFILQISCLDFKEASNHDKEPLLKEHIVRVLDAACWRVRSNQRKVVEEDGLDIEYLLHRACVELAAIRKEKEHTCTKLWIPREYDDLMDTWHKFEKKWKPLLLSQSQTRAEELEVLKKVHEELVSYLRDEKAVKDVEMSSRMFQKFNDIRAKIELSINRVSLEEYDPLYILIPWWEKVKYVVALK
ncbi:hypothetical protein REPUB_Repub14bG0134000 [Reevesia pubescens]